MRLARRTCFLLTNFYAEARGALGGGGQRIDNVHLPVECSERRARGLRTRGQRSVKPQARVKEVFIPPGEAVNSMPPSPAWFWNPSKKIIYGDLLFWYPMGNTPARNLLEGLGPASSSALLLGCGDIRNVLETCRQAKPVERKLTFALNDFNASTIARDVLLFAIADQIDASNVGDVDFLWSVWYNLQVPEEHFFRLRKVVKEILDGHGEAKSWLKIGGKDLEEVETVYRSWLVEESLLPDVDDVQEMRKERMVEFLNKGKLGEKMGDHGWEKWIKILQEPSLLNLRNASLRELGSEECSLYVETGSITRDDPGDVENFLPNVTLLHPESRRWLNHYGSTPFPAYRGIVTDKNLQDAGGLVKACQRRLQEWVVALQTRTRRERPTVEVSMHCSDALEFCLCGGSSRSFDVIDTTNLADHVGLLNLVLCASSKLINKPGSRLSTSSLTWVFDNESLRDYVDEGLSFNSKFAPTILGLRLVTDLELGKFPVQAQDYMLFGGGGHDERRLDWEPVACPSPPITVDDALIGRSMQTDEKIPQEPEPCAISVQLARIVRTCCLLPLGKSMRERCGLRLSSPTTLALLLRNMGSRCVLESSGKAPIAGFSDWCKTYCVSFGLEAEKVARLMDSTQGGLVEVRGPLRRDRMLAAMTTSTPIIRVGLVHRSLWEKSTNIELINNALASDLKARHSADMSQVHVIDNASVDDEMNVRFLLPEDHGLEASEWEVVLIDSDRPLGITVHSYSSLESMEQVPFQAPVNLVDRGIERRGGAHIDGARITHLKEYGDRFVAGLSYESSLQDSKIVTKFNQARPDESSLSVDLELQLVPNQSLKIDFPSPVVPHGEKFKRRRSKQKVQCIFPKSSIFPIHASFALELIDVSNLPEHKDEDEVVMKMGRMFSIQEMMFKQSDDNTAVSVDPFYDLRNTIQILFVRLIKDDLRIHLLYGDIEQSKTTDDPILSIVVMGPIRRMDDGEPALLVSYVDHAVDVKARMKAGRFNGHRFACRFQSILSEFGTKGNNIVAVGEEEVKLLRKMLAENSAKMKPSRWQAKHVEDDSEWRPSFVKPMYPENIKTAQVGSRELREKVGKMSVEDAMKELINMELSSGGSPRETVEKLREKGGATEEELKQLESFLGRSSREAGVATQTGNVQATREEGSVATKCGNCGITSGLKRCSGCKKIWYCGRDCQKEHWRDHKHQCGK